jgi:hypothetical protein
LIQLLLIAICLLIAFYGLRPYFSAASPAVRGGLRKWMFWLGLLLLIVLAPRLGWVVPLLGAAFMALMRLAPLLLSLAPLLQKILRGTMESSAPGEAPRARPSTGRMSRQEALEILGLANGASRDEIVAAHRRLMQKMHPDRGGSDYLAGQINLARDTLINH